MAISPHCDFCKKELVGFGGLLFSPPKKNGEVRKFHLCQHCYREIIKIAKLGIREIEDVISVGPAWPRNCLKTYHRMKKVHVSHRRPVIFGKKVAYPRSEYWSTPLSSAPFFPRM